MSEPAMFQCKNNHAPFPMKPNHVMEGRICPYCFQDIVKQREVDYRKWLEENTNLHIVSEFVGMTSDVWLQCDKGHEKFKTRPSYTQRPITDDKKHGPTGCKWCRKEQCRTNNQVKKVIAQQVTNND